MAQAKKVDIADVIETQTNAFFTYSTVALCCLVMLVDGFDNQAINYTSAAIIRDWGIERVLFTPVFWANTLGWMTGSLIFSIIADKIGRRNATIFATVLFGGFTYAMAFATGIWDLMAYKFISSVGVGGAMPMAIALIADYTRGRRRGLMVTALFIGYSGGTVGGGFIAAEMINAPDGWQSIFQLGGLVGLIVAGLLVFTLPESVRYLLVQGAPQDKIRGYVRRMRPTIPFDSDTEFFIKEQKKQTGVPLKFLFQEGRAWMTTFLWLALGFSFVTHFFISNWLPILLSDYMPLDQVNRVKAMFQLGAFFGFVFGWLIDRYGVPVVTVTKLVGAIPVALIGVALVFEASVFLLVVVTLISGICVLGGTIGLNAISSMVYPTFIRSTGSGAAFAAARIGAFMGPSLGAAMIWLEVPIIWMFIIGAVPMVLSGIFAYLLSTKVDVLYKRKDPHSAPADDREPAVDRGHAPARP
jgi:AAHS family 4-hydroxybenzoate transporter-like MFS transporter